MPFNGAWPITLTYCLLCMQEGEEIVGDARHRLGICRCLRQERQALPATWQHQIASSRNRWLWDRGLAPDPSQRYAFRAQEEDARWLLGDSDQPMFTGDGAPDGSRIESWRTLAALGWPPRSWRTIASTWQW